MVFYDGGRAGRRRELWVAAGVLALAVVLRFLPTDYQRPVRDALQGTVLRPFTEAQRQLSSRRDLRVDVRELLAQRDSLAALVAAQGTLAEENRRLRGLLGLRARARARFIPAEVIRIGTLGSESTFMLDVGTADGVQVGSPVMAAGGLLGVVWEVGERQAQAVDWTHPEFRASAMTSNGEVYGLLEPRRGRFREEDVLALTGAPFHSDVQPGTLVVTSGRGQVLPRGVPVGTVLGIEEADTGWRKSYLVRPAVRPEGVTHVLVAVVGEDGALADVSELWYVTAARDSGRAAVRPAPRDTAGQGTAGMP